MCKLEQLCVIPLCNVAPDFTDCSMISQRYCYKRTGPNLPCDRDKILSLDHDQVCYFDFKKTTAQESMQTHMVHFFIKSLL